MTGTNWNGWKITDEQAEEIRNGNAEARNRFYIDNYERIRKMAYNYTQKHIRTQGQVEDLTQGVMVDLCVFQCAYNKPVTNGGELSLFVYWSFRAAPDGGLLYLWENNRKALCGGSETYLAPANQTSLDAPLGKGTKRHQDEDNASSLLDIIPAPSEEERRDHTEDCKKAVADFLTPRTREYFALFIEGYTPTEIGRKMGCKGTGYGAYGNRMRENLSKNYLAILERLEGYGIGIGAYKGKTPIDKTAPRVYKLSPEQRAKAAESMRRQRAAKKALANT